MVAIPVEYAEAVERYLASGRLAPSSQRIYRIALTSWAWPLVDRPVPHGGARRGAVPPVVPFALLAEPATLRRLDEAVRARAAAAEPRTLARETAALRSALDWWRAQGWLSGPPTGLRSAVGVGVGVEPVHPSSLTPLSPGPARAAAVLALAAPLREQTLWHLLHDSGAGAERLLALDLADLDQRARRTRARGHAAARPAAEPLRWGDATAELLRLLLLGRLDGPVFLTSRRAPAGTPQADVCRLTGRGRLSYRRAAEVFREATRGLDNTGRGWRLGVLRVSGAGGGAAAA